MSYATRAIDALKEALGDLIRPGERVGIFLSGGLDSAVLQALVRAPFAFCCSWPFDGEDNYSRAVYASCNVPLHEVTFDRDHLVALTPVVARLTNGRGTWSQVCQLEMARHAKSCGCDVVITGECSDELFGGYARYRVNYWAQRMRDDLHLSAYQKYVEAVVKDMPTVREAMAHDAGAPLAELLEHEAAVIQAAGPRAVFPFGHPAVRAVAATLPDDQLVTEQETKHCLRDVARILGVHPAIVNETTKKGLYVPQSWRPEGAPMWDRTWFEELMRHASQG